MTLYDINGNKIISSTSVENYNRDKWNGKVLVTDGNSLVASSNWGEPLAEYLGMTHYNLGNSGSMITPASDTMETIKSNIANNYPSKADLIILQGDTNGNMNGEVADQMDGDEPKTTWCARMNYFVRCLKAKYHNVIIVIMPDSVRYDGGFEQYYPHMVHGEGFGNRNRESYEIMKAFAEYNRLLFWNVDGSTPFNPLHDDNYYSRLGYPNSTHPTQDYVHPYQSYVTAKGKAIGSYVESLIFDPNAPNDSTDGWEDLVSCNITYNLTNVSCNKTATVYAMNTPFKPTLTANDGYTLGTVSVTMGGVDVTETVYANGVITIWPLTGDVVITATAS